MSGTHAYLPRKIAHTLLGYTLTYTYIHTYICIKKYKIVCFKLTSYTCGFLMKVGKSLQWKHIINCMGPAFSSTWDSKTAFWMLHLLHILLFIFTLRMIFKSYFIHLSSLTKSFFIMYFLPYDNFTWRKLFSSPPRHFPRYSAATKKPQSFCPYLFHLHKTYFDPQFSFTINGCTCTDTILYSRFCGERYWNSSQENCLEYF